METQLTLTQNELWPLSDEEAAQKIVSFLRDLEIERKTGGTGEDLLSCVFENLADEVRERRRQQTKARYAREKAQAGAIAEDNLPY